MFKKTLLTVAMISALSGCGDYNDQESDTSETTIIQNYLTRTVSIEALDQCSGSSGVAIELGNDSDGNGALDDEEVASESTAYVCNGVDVSGAEIDVDGNLVLTLSSGQVLSLGEVKGSDGVSVSGTEIDADGNLIIRLSNDEVINLGTVNGVDGVGVSASEIDADGNLIIRLSNDEVINLGTVNGVDGVDGVSISTININEEGLLTVTLSDGTVTDVGSVRGVSVASTEIDSDGNLVFTFSDGAVVSAGSVKGSDGQDGVNTLVSVIDVAEGESCPLGGKAIITGIDADGSGELEESEQGTPIYVCNQATTGTMITEGPVPSFTQLITNEDEVFSGQLTGVGVSGGSLHYVATGLGSNGVVKINSDGSFTYQPLADFNGTDSFKYEIYEDSLKSIEQEVLVTVQAVNDNPVVSWENAESLTVNADEQFTIQGVYSDVDLDSLTYKWFLDTAEVSQGTAVQTSVHVPGDYTLTAKVYDGHGGEGEKSIPVEVLGVIAAPTNVLATTSTGTVPVNRIEWDAVSGANGYRVYRSDKVNGVYTQMQTFVVNGEDIAELQDTFWEDETGQPYYYQVRTVGAESGLSKASDTVQGVYASNIRTNLDSPTDVDLDSAQSLQLQRTYYDFSTPVNPANFYRVTSDPSQTYTVLAKNIYVSQSLDEPVSVRIYDESQNLIGEDSISLNESKALMVQPLGAEFFIEFATTTPDFNLEYLFSVLPSNSNDLIQSSSTHEPNDSKAIAKIIEPVGEVSATLNQFDEVDFYQVSQPIGEPLNFNIEYTEAFGLIDDELVVMITDEVGNVQFSSSVELGASLSIESNMISDVAYIQVMQTDESVGAFTKNYKVNF